MYKIALTDHNGDEFIGTTRCITTDGRYSLDTVDTVVREFISHLFDKSNISGYNLYKNSFNSDIFKTVKL